MYHEAIETDPALHDESARLAALRALEVLDTEPEEPFENVVSLVRSVLGVPMAAVSLIDEDRQWFKARAGIEDAETARDVSFCTHAIGQRGAFVVGDASCDDRFVGNPLVTGAPYIRAYAGIPLETPEGYNVGTLCAIDAAPRAFTDAEVAMLASFARIVVNELELRRIADRDGLTGVLTRRGFEQKAQHELNRYRRYGRDACLVMFDVDHFKAVNDVHGHGAGDTVLRELARTLSAARRPTDVLGRLGGEEFAMLLPECTLDEAMHAAERFRALIEENPVMIGEGKVLNLTSSIGVAPLSVSITTVEQWLAAADAPLYEAKRGGRNRCVAAH